MEVQLYVYDLTHGMARQMSQQLLGIHIDAVYHTSLVFQGIEYFFGAGVQTCYAGTTHHGRPMEIVPMGTTQLPLETILEYLESLKEVYTPESYDLFAHNCNNFTNDFAMFLVGKGTPEHITSLPKRVLETPFGQMLKPQIEAGMRGVTQAPVPPQNVPTKSQSTATQSSPSASKTSNTAPSVPTGPPGAYGRVYDVDSQTVLQGKLSLASETAATVFFTSSTCAPCKMAYPAFDQLAEQYSNALFVKVDINSARDVASAYQIRATPTFMTFTRGRKQDEWQGADPRVLKANVEQLMQTTFPPHPHTRLKVQTLQFGSLRPISYTKVPPLDKLTAKLGEAGTKPEIISLRNFIAKRADDPKEAPLPDLRAVSKVFRTQIPELPVEVRFAAVDLLRCALVDRRASGFFAEEQGEQTIPALIAHVNSLDDCPHNLRLVTLHLACNLFLSHLYVKELLTPGSRLVALLVQLITSSLLDNSHPTTRVAAASIAFNLTSSNYRVRREESREGILEGEQVELAASLLETISNEENADALKTELTALGYVVYCAPEAGEVLDLCQALDAKATVKGVKGDDMLRNDVASLL